MYLHTELNLRNSSLCHCYLIQTFSRCQSHVEWEMKLDVACPSFIKPDRLPLPGYAWLGASSMKQTVMVHASLRWQNYREIIAADHWCSAV